jgi:deoxyribodipyrimidine photo-lyase
MIEKQRITLLNKYPVKDGKYIIYWMQAAQRTEFNHTLEYAIN